MTGRIPAGRIAAQCRIGCPQIMPRPFQQQEVHRGQKQVGGRLAGLAARGQALEAFIPINRGGEQRIKRRALSARIFRKVPPIVFFLGVQGVPADSVFLKHNPHCPAQGQV